jgi:SAM-dependent methyltransferase
MTSIKSGAKAVLKGLALEGPGMRARDRQRARRATRHHLSRVGADGLPIPPAELISQVAGPLSDAEFLAGGAAGRRIISETLGRNGVDVDQLSSLLDFGVGCGRVARHWVGIPAEVHGCDYNPALVEWCDANLPHVRATRNKLDPPLPYDGEMFDFVYALSVFTHLTESQQRTWSAELRRVTRVGGHVLFTTHGPTFPHQDPSFSTPEIRERLERGELIVFEPGHAGRNNCAALSPRSWVEANMLDGFELVEYVERGAEMNGGQDIYLVRREP